MRSLGAGTGLIASYPQDLKATSSSGQSVDVSDATSQPRFTEEQPGGTGPGPQARDHTAPGHEQEENSSLLAPRPSPPESL